MNGRHEGNLSYKEVSFDILQGPDGDIENSNDPEGKIQDIDIKIPINFRENCCFVKCPYCSQTGKTVLVRKPGKFVYVSTLLCCLFTPPLCFIPFCLKKCYDKAHYCSKCSNQLGLGSIL